MGQEDGKKWAAAAPSQPTIPKSDRLLDAACSALCVRVHYPELHLCTDNGAMIALAAAMRLQAGRQQASCDYAFDVKPRWPLEALDAENP